jgi:hypothetical protein
VLIEISELRPTLVGKKTATAVATGGDKFSVWPGQLAQVQVGRRYEVEIWERVWQGRTLRSLTKITLYANGHAHQPGEQFVLRLRSRPACRPRRY